MCMSVCVKYHLPSGLAMYTLGKGEKCLCLPFGRHLHVCVRDELSVRSTVRKSPVSVGLATLWETVLIGPFPYLL